MGTGTLLSGALILSAVGTGVSAISAIDQRNKAKAAAAKAEAAQKAELAAQQKERKTQIDALRQSALGLTSGRKTLLSGSETGEWRGGMLSATLG